MRPVSRHRPELAARAIALLQRIRFVPLTNDVVVNVATIGTPALRTLDALQPATAAAIADELDTFITYDKRLADAAVGIGLSVAAPS